MKVNYDKIADAVYIRLKNTKVKKTKEVSDRLVIDLDLRGDVVGIEVLNASTQQGIVKNLEKNAEKGIPIEIVSALIPV